MARFQLHTKAPDISLDVIIPDSYDGRLLPALWLLHDFGGSCSSWLRFSKAEYYAGKYEIALVCISGENGFFANQANGVQWDDNFIDKLWPTIQEMFPVSDSKELNAIAGCGMGGYGAVHTALMHPELFSWAAAFSGNLRAPISYAEGRSDWPDWLDAEDVFGDRSSVKGSSFDMKYVMKLAAGEGKKPQFGLYLAAAAADEVLSENESFASFAKELGYEVCLKSEDGEGGWPFYDRQLESFIQLLRR